MKEIDLEQWERKDLFQFFYGMDYPQYNIGFNLDVSSFLPETKKRGMSFYLAMIYVSTLSVNQVEEFRYRIRDGKVVLHERVNPSFTYLEKDEELFKVVTVDMTDNLADFIRDAKSALETQETFIMPEKFVGRDDFIYYSSIPWISFTHISHTIKLNKDDAVPRITWGKYFEENGTILLPYSVQAHHSFVDGFHLGKLKEVLEENMSNIATL